MRKVCPNPKVHVMYCNRDDRVKNKKYCDNCTSPARWDRGEYNKTRGNINGSNL